MHAEGRSANIPTAVARYQPVTGGRDELFLESSDTAKRRGIRNGDTVKISNELGAITARARVYRRRVQIPWCFRSDSATGRTDAGRAAARPATAARFCRMCRADINLACYYTAKVKVEKA